MPKSIQRIHLSIGLGLCAALGVILLAGCNRPHQTVIGVIPKATAHLFFVSIHAGVDQAAKEYHVEALWNGPSTWLVSESKGNPKLQ